MAKQSVVMMSRSVDEYLKRIVKHRRGRPPKAIAEHLRLVARSIVLEDSHQGQGSELHRSSATEVQVRLGEEYGYSSNPFGEESENGSKRSVRRALKQSRSYLFKKLKWSGHCVNFVGKDSWFVVFIRGFNPMAAKGYTFSKLDEPNPLSFKPPLTWYAVYHWEYMEPTDNPNNPAEIGIRRRVDECVECKPFSIELPGINVP